MSHVLVTILFLTAAVGHIGHVSFQTE